MPAVSLVSVNIERSKHLDLVTSFLTRREADVVCMQELMESDSAVMVEAIGAAAHLFVPMCRMRENGSVATEGLGIFSRVPIKGTGVRHYKPRSDELPEQDITDPTTYNNARRFVLWADIEKEGVVYRIATAHFTWTPDGSADNAQRRDAATLLAQLEKMGELVLAGDFNAPRTMRDGSPGEIFGMLAARYKDNIPPQYTTSIDGSLHSAGPIPLMVDGIFSTPGYQVSDVALHSGVSDHCAITATVTKAA